MSSNHVQLIEGERKRQARPFEVLMYLALAALLVAVSSQAVSGEENRGAESRGAYFGQQPPGMAPEMFAPGFISTGAYEITPTFSPGLDEVFFTRRPTEGGSDNKLYYSRKVDGVWQEPALASFSSGQMEFEAQFSCDGKRVYFGRGDLLCVSEKTADGWSKAQVLDEPVREGMCAAIARNDNLYFVAWRSKKYGIFRAIPNGHGYAEPELVIPKAAHPFVAPDESYMVFDKYSFVDGKQKSALYVSFRDSTSGWSEPVKFGDEINATGTELIAKVSPDGKYLFFQRKVDGNTDVWWVDAKVIEEVRGE